MPGGFSVKLEGFDEVMRQLDNKGIAEDISQVLTIWGRKVAETAQQNAPVDEGYLRAHIGSEMIDQLTVSVFCNCNYAAYLEFGTRKFAASYVSSLPQEWKIFAATFKGPGGGSFNEMVMRITEWVKRKGFAAQLTSGGNASKSKSSVAAQEQAAYQIALSIIRNGIRPQPFLYPAFNENRAQLIKDLRDLLTQPRK